MWRARLVFILFGSIFYGLGVSDVFGEVIYVDSSATGADDGGSWENAYVELQSALAAAVYGDQIRVAAGTYKPDYDTGTETHTGNRELSFRLKDGIELYGGFSIGGGCWEDRDWKTYETILSGDLGGNDGPDFSHTTGNSFHVVISRGAILHAVIDGFTIKGGNADNNPFNPESSSGGGIRVDGNLPTIRNCTIRANQAQLGGGIMLCAISSSIISNCVIQGNRANDGGGIMCLGSSPLIKHCVISGNLQGDGIFCISHSNPTILNCTIIGNRDYGIYGEENSHPIIKNSLVFYNLRRDVRIYSHNNFKEIYPEIPTSLIADINIRDDPLYAQPGYWDDNGTPEEDIDDFWVEGDYHLKSQAGRWDPNWVKDDVTSPYIDAGDPASDWSAELWPHGGRINMGAYGGTVEASMSSDTSVGNIADLNLDGKVDLLDYDRLTDWWREEEILLKEDLSRNGRVDAVDLEILCENWLWEE